MTQEELKKAGTEGALAAETIDGFAALLRKEFRPTTDRAAEEVSRSVQTLASLALEDAALISNDALATIEKIIAELDRKLTQQVNQILHSPVFQNLESTWRGLHYLVNNSETDSSLKIRVINASKADLQRSLKRYKGVLWDQSPLFKQVYEQEFGQLGGQPYGCLVGDYQFDHTAPDVDMLKSLSQIAGAAHAPFIAAGSPTAFQMQSWQELANPRDLTKIFDGPEYASWRSFRASEDARYIGLTMPRFLGRLPYGAATDPIEEFAFEEEVDGSDHSKYTWCNSAFAMAVNINRSFKEYGWCSRIRGVESGGAVEGLPVHTFPSDDGSVDAKCPTEIAISDRREAELAKAGFMPLIHRKNSDTAAFLGAQSLQKPAEYDDPDATANANLAARLPYLFATCRFAHYLKCMVRDKVGSYSSRDSMEVELHNWIMNYVVGDTKNATEDEMARKPLAAAEVIVEENEENPGYYGAKFFLRPHYQLEGLTVSLRLVSKLPSAKGGGG